MDGDDSSTRAPRPQRLGLEINMNNDAGWNGSGGPWITPEHVDAEGGVERDGRGGRKTAPVVLPQPQAVDNYYQDIAVLAMPAPAVNSRSE